MMRLSTMKRLFETFDSENRSPIANRLLEPWTHEPDSLRFVRASANFVWTFKHGEKTCVLRANLDSERTTESFQREVRLMQHLKRKGWQAPQPVLSQAGRHVEQIATERGTFLVLAYEAVVGRIYEPEELSDGQVLEWGEALGRLHNAMEDTPAEGQNTWAELCEFTEMNLLPDETELRSAYYRIRSRLEGLPSLPGESGLIQFDFESDNLIWTDQGIGVIDLDESCRMWHAADIAFALRSAFHDDPARVDLTLPQVSRFLEGYRRARPLRPEMVEQLPLFLAFHNIYMAARLIRSLSDGELPGEPEWMPALRLKLMSRIGAYRKRAAVLGSSSSAANGV